MYFFIFSNCLLFILTTSQTLYKIQSNNTRVLHHDSNTNNDTVIGRISLNKTDSNINQQLWYLNLDTNLGSNVYEIKSYSDNRCLHILDTVYQQQSKGQHVKTFDCTGNDNQRFVVDTIDGSLTNIKPYNFTIYCVEMDTYDFNNPNDNGVLTNGARIDYNYFGGALEESWYFINTQIGTNTPTNIPTINPVTSPPTMIPTILPTKLTKIPTKIPTNIPTMVPTSNSNNPTLNTLIPTKIPSVIPTIIPTQYTNTPTLIPSMIPTVIPTMNTVTPTKIPTMLPSVLPTKITNIPTLIPTIIPTVLPTMNTVTPTNIPTIMPSVLPTKITNIPTNLPTFTVFPTMFPTKITDIPTNVPSMIPSLMPTLNTVNPTNIPSIIPSNVPTLVPSKILTKMPTVIPTLITTIILTTKQQTSKFSFSDIPSIYLFMAVGILLLIVFLVGCCVCYFCGKHSMMKRRLIEQNSENQSYKSELNNKQTEIFNSLQSVSNTSQLQHQIITTDNVINGTDTQLSIEAEGDPEVLSGNKKLPSIPKVEEINSTKGYVSKNDKVTYGNSDVDGDDEDMNSDSDNSGGEMYNTTNGDVTEDGNVTKQ